MYIIIYVQHGPLGITHGWSTEKILRKMRSLLLGPHGATLTQERKKDQTDPLSHVNHYLTAQYSLLWPSMCVLRNLSVYRMQLYIQKFNWCLVSSTETASKSKGMEIWMNSILHDFFCDVNVVFMYDLCNDLFLISLTAHAHGFFFWMMHQSNMEWTKAKRVNKWVHDERKAASTSSVSSKAVKHKNTGLNSSEDSMSAGLHFITNKIEKCNANNNEKMPHSTLLKTVTEN